MPSYIRARLTDCYSDGYRWSYVTPIRRKSIKQLRDLGIEFVDADWELAKDAGYFKSRSKMSFADCFAVALAKKTKAHLATGDPEFKQLEREITIGWL